MCCESRVYKCWDKRWYSRVENVCWVVHAILEGTVEMWKGLCAAAETHVLAEVVAAFGAVGAVVAHDASLYCDTLSDDEVLYTWTDGCDGASCFMAEDEGCLEGKVSVASVNVVVDCDGGQRWNARAECEKRRLTVASAETSALDGDLHLTLLWGPEGALFVAHVLWAVEDDCILLFESYWRHWRCWAEEGGGRAVEGGGQGAAQFIVALCFFWRAK